MILSLIVVCAIDVRQKRREYRGETRRHDKTKLASRWLSFLLFNKPYSKQDIARHLTEWRAIILSRPHGL